MDKTYTFNDFRKIVETLRSPEGCPWDRAQTHESLCPYMKEEAQEVVDAVMQKDDDNLCEELGDVLLEVMLFARVAEEEGLFSIDDVIQGISEKMIRRHPHVFGDKSQEAPSWEEIKRLEKEQKKQRKLAKILDKQQ